MFATVTGPALCAPKIDVDRRNYSAVEFYITVLCTRYWMVIVSLLPFAVRALPK